MRIRSRLKLISAFAFFFFIVAATHSIGSAQKLDDGKLPLSRIILERNPIEVTQVIQTRDNRLPLVSGKKTVARVYVKTKPIGSMETAESCAVYLYGSRLGVSLPGSPLTLRHSAPININRGQAEDTANFLLPEGWNEGRITLRAEAVSASSRRVLSHDIPVVFVPRKTPTYWIIPTNLGTSAAPDIPSESDIAAQENFLKKIYPVPDVNFVRKPWQAIGPTTTFGAEIITDLNNYYNEVLLGWVFGLIIAGESPFEMPEQVYGAVVGGNSGSSDPVWLGANGKVAYGAGDYGGIIMAHEVDHNLGPGNCNQEELGFWGRHVSSRRGDTREDDPAAWCVEGEDSLITYGCHAGNPDRDWQVLYDDDDIHEYGIDTSTWPPQILDKTTPDLMSYCKNCILSCTQPAKWISDYRWQKLFDYFSVPMAPVYPESLIAGKDMVYYVSGRINLDGTGVINPIRVLPGIPTEKTIQGDYTIELDNMSGEKVFAFSFFPVFLDVEGERHQSFHFNYHIPALSDIGAVRLINKEGKVLHTIQVSKNYPELKIIAPTSGGVWKNGFQKIMWGAKDLDGDKLSFSIFYTHDGGKIWTPIANNLKENFYEVHTSILPAGEKAIIRVIATDGFNTIQKDSAGYFTVLNSN